MIFFSQTGKRLMAKCRMLLQENEELGKVISSGRTAKLEGEIALEKTLVQEMKKSQAGRYRFIKSPNPHTVFKRKKSKTRNSGNGKSNHGN